MSGFWRSTMCLGASLLLQYGANCALCNTSTAKPEHLAQENTRYRVASITKMATALVTLRCIDNGLFALDSEAASDCRTAKKPLCSPA